jgi:hypothetical protein
MASRKRADVYLPDVRPSSTPNPSAPSTPGLSNGSTRDSYSSSVYSVNDYSHISSNEPLKSCPKCEVAVSRRPGSPIVRCYWCRENFSWVEAQDYLTHDAPGPYPTSAHSISID